MNPRTEKPGFTEAQLEHNDMGWISKVAPQKVLFTILAVALLCSACNTKKPKAKPWPKIEAVEFSVFDLTTKPFSDNKYETKPGCPWMSDKAVEQMTPEGYEMRWNVADYPHSTVHKCIVHEPTLHYKSDPGWLFAITTLKKDISPEQLKTPPSEPRQDVGVIPPEDDRTYAGSSFDGDTGQMSYWRCGKYLIQHGRNNTKTTWKTDTDARHVALDLGEYRTNTTRFMLAQISALCGTVEKPTAAVTDYPNIGWYTHLHYESRSPSEYGVPKPPGLPDVATSTAPASANTANYSRKP